MNDVQHSGGKARTLCRELLDALPDAAIALARDGTILMANTAGRALLEALGGLTVGERLTRIDDQDITQLAPDARLELDCGWQRAGTMKLSIQPLVSGDSTGRRLLLSRGISRESTLASVALARRHDLGMLCSLTRTLSTSSCSEKALGPVAREIVLIAGVTSCRVLALHDGAFVCRTTSSAREADEPEGVLPEPAVLTPMYRRLLDHAEPMIIVAGTHSLTHTQHRALKLDRRAMVCLVPLVVGGRQVGVLELVEERQDGRNRFGLDKLELVLVMADQLSNALLRNELDQQLIQSHSQTALALAMAVDARDSRTADHSKRMVSMTIGIAKELDCDERQTTNLRWGALLHDVGKIGVPDKVLLKPGPLDDDDWRKMRLHPEIGESIITRVPQLAAVTPIIRSHHERMDGSGYPDGLRGAAIPLEARIVAVADSYSAMTEDRVYRPALGHPQAMAALDEGRGDKYDPAVLDAFERVIRAQGIPEA